MRRRGLLSAALVAGLVLVGGCAGSSDAGDGASTGSKEDHAQRRNITRSVRAVVGDQVLEATVHPVERVDDHVVLTVDYSIPAGSESETSLEVQSYMEECLLCGGTSTVRLVDLPGARVWKVGSAWSEENNASVTLNKQSLLRVAPGETVTSVAFFGAVETDTVSVFIQHVGLIMDVPVVDGDASTPGIDSLGLDNPLPLGGHYYEDSVPVYLEPFPLESLMEAYDESTSIKKQGTKQTVIMASDVLFDTDVAELSDEAASRVDEVAEQIAEVASGGEVRVVGHTDDVDTEEYNLDLSQRRAASVAERMKATLGTSFTVVEEGKGESQPAVEGTDTEARTANRRVEIEFTATDAITLSEETSDVPEATGPVSSGHDPVTYLEAYRNQTSITSHVSSVVRRDGYLVGTLVASQDDSGAILYNAVCRGSANTGAACLRLLGPDGYVPPVQHKQDWSDGGYRTGLSDYRHLKLLEAGGSSTYTIVWPDTGEDSVTVESPGMFRITGIPVEEG